MSIVQFVFYGGGGGGGGGVLKNILDKEENACQKHFLLCSSMFTEGFLSGALEVYMFGKGMNLSQTSPCVYVSIKSFENTVGKGKIAHYEQFSLSHSALYP